MRKNFLLATAAAFALAVAAPASASDVILFDPDGGGAVYDPFSIDQFDMTTGNSLSVDLNGESGVGEIGDLLYQANLALASLGGVTQYSNGDSNTFFTIVAGFEERISSSVTDPGTGDTTILFRAPTIDDSLQGYFYIYAQDGFGDNLAGECFVESCGGTLILSGQIINNINFFGNFSTNLIANIQDLDQFNGDDYPAVNTVSGGGFFRADIDVSFADPNYFPTMDALSSFLFASSQNSLPFLAVDPSACFSTDGVISCTQQGVSTVGAINGLGSNTILQTDASLTFETQQLEVVPEPATLGLLGFGLLGAVALRRRAQRRK